MAGYIFKNRENHPLIKNWCLYNENFKFEGCRDLTIKQAEKLAKTESREFVSAMFIFNKTNGTMGDSNAST